jgi:hypothetical protein
MAIREETAGIRLMRRVFDLQTDFEAHRITAGRLSGLGVTAALSKDAADPVGPTCRDRRDPRSPRYNFRLRAPHCSAAVLTTTITSSGIEMHLCCSAPIAHPPIWIDPSVRSETRWCISGPAINFAKP